MLALLPILFALAIIRDWLPIVVLFAIATALTLIETGTIRLKRLLATVFPVAVLLPWSFRHADPLLSMGPFTVSSENLSFAGIFSLKLATLVMLVSTVIACSSLAQHANAATRLGAPSLLTQVLTMSWRYVFLLTDEWNRLRMALRVRGFTNRMNQHGRRAVGQALGAMLVRSHDRAERVGWAMKTRGFDGKFRSLDSTKIRLGDVAMVIAGIALGGVVIGWDVIR